MPQYKAPAEKKQEPVKDNPPAAAAKAADSTQEKYAPSQTPISAVIYESFHPFAFLFSGLGSILILLAIIITIALALDTSYFIASGWPDDNLASDLEQFFGYPEWPGLVDKIGAIVTGVLLILSATFLSIGRRHHGAAHLIRALLGLGGLTLAIITFHDAAGIVYSQEIANMLISEQIGPAIDKLLQSFNIGEVMFTLLFFLPSIVLLAWPAKRKPKILTASQNQGVN